MNGQPMAPTIRVAFIADAAEGFVFDGGLHWLRPLRMFLGKASKCQFLCCFFFLFDFLVFGFVGMGTRWCG